MFGRRVKGKNKSLNADYPIKLSIYSPQNGHPEVSVYIPVWVKRSKREQTLNKSPAMAVLPELLNLVSQVGS